MKRFVLPAVLLTACGGKLDAGTDEPYSWPGGFFDMSSYEVTDDCLDNGFSALLLPEGEGSTSEWQYPVELPTWAAAETPVTYDINLQDPFSAMEVSVVQGSANGQFDVTSDGQEGVVFSSSAAGDCLVDMNISAIIVLEGAENVRGYAELRITNATDGGTGVCPTDPFGDPFTTPCSVDLDFTGLLTD